MKCVECGLIRHAGHFCHQPPMPSEFEPTPGQRYRIEAEVRVMNDGTSVLIDGRQWAHVPVSAFTWTLLEPEWKPGDLVRDAKGLQYLRIRHHDGERVWLRLSDEVRVYGIELSRPLRRYVLEGGDDD